MRYKDVNYRNEVVLAHGGRIGTTELMQRLQVTKWIHFLAFSAGNPQNQAAARAEARRQIEQTGNPAGSMQALAQNVRDHYEKPKGS